MVDAPPIGKQNSGFYRLEMNRPELDVGCWMWQRSSRSENESVTMKTILFLLILVLGVSASAFARIGETTEQVDRRYGAPLETTKDKGESRRYSFRGFTVLVNFERGISQCEVYQKKDISRMTEAEIKGLLGANAGGSAWRDDADEGSDTYIYRSKDGRSRIAIYNLRGHDLMVTSKAFLDRHANIANSADRQKMKGF